MKQILLEGYAFINEQAHITGVALIPSISRNNNLYTKEELKRFDNVRVPLNWEHNPEKEIGYVTFHYNSEIETVFYDGFITDEAAANLAKNRKLYTSIEADPVDMKDICNGPDDCFHMPFGLIPKALALTETPGIPQTSVTVIENYIRECEIDKDLEKKYGREWNSSKEQGRGEPNDDCIAQKISKIANDKPDMTPDQRVAIAISMCSEKEIKEYLMKEVFHLVAEYCPHCGEVKKKNK